MEHRIKKYGWIKDKVDPRDFKYSAIRPVEIELPSSIDLRNSCPPVFDQGNLGSCTANALAAGVDFIHRGFLASRLFIYYNERVIESSVDYDSGAELRDGIKTLSKEGVCDESDWPYDVAAFTQKPLSECYDIAKKDIISSYHAIHGLQEMKSCLAEGYPFVFGFTVYESFESPEVAKTGVVPMPTEYDQPVGGHAVIAVGYDDDKQALLVRNSWGDGWGEGGYFWLPYAYVESSELANDFWTIRK